MFAWEVRRQMTQPTVSDKNALGLQEVLISGHKVAQVRQKWLYLENITLDSTTGCQSQKSVREDHSDIQATGK